MAEPDGAGGRDAARDEAGWEGLAVASAGRVSVPIVATRWHISVGNPVTSSSARGAARR